MRTDRQTERRDKANNLFSQFFEHALKYQGVATSSDKVHIISFMWIRKLLQSLHRDTHADRNTDIMVSYAYLFTREYENMPNSRTQLRSPYDAIY